MAKKGQKFRKYSTEEKLSITLKHINEGKSARYLSDETGISRKTIETWIRKFKREGTLVSKPKGRPKFDDEITYKEKYEVLKKYLDFLKEEEQEKK